MLDSVSILLIARWINDPTNPKLDNDNNYQAGSASRGFI